MYRKNIIVIFNPQIATIRTPMTQATFYDPGRVAWIEEKIKLDHVGEIEDIMGAVVYLALSQSLLQSKFIQLLDTITQQV